VRICSATFAGALCAPDRHRGRSHCSMRAVSPIPHVAAADAAGVEKRPLRIDTAEMSASEIVHFAAIRYLRQLAIITAEEHAVVVDVTHVLATEVEAVKVHRPILLGRRDPTQPSAPVIHDNSEERATLKRCATAKANSSASRVRGNADP